jgi:LysM repeat protein
MTLQVYPPEGSDLTHVVFVSDGDVRCLVVGSDEFYAHFEGLRGRKRTTIVVAEGDTWEKIGKRYNLTIGQLERINQRSHFEKLAPRDSLVVYAPSGQPVARSNMATATGPKQIDPAVAPNPEDLPALPEAPSPSGSLPQGRTGGAQGSQSSLSAAPTEP